MSELLKITVYPYSTEPDAKVMCIELESADRSLTLMFATAAPGVKGSVDASVFRSWFETRREFVETSAELTLPQSIVSATALDQILRKHATVQVYGTAHGYSVLNHLLRQHGFAGINANVETMLTLEW
jgi:hypothetical protein